jgi:4-amino-4-deoxy-L-arabinose transferase-like glycosyltransferase
VTTSVAEGADTEDAPSAAPPVHRRAPFWVGLVAAMVVALVIRLWFHSFAPTNLPIMDGLWYHTSANLIAEGRGLIDPFPYVFQGQVRETAAHPPLFPFLLSGVSWFGGVSVGAHQYAEIGFDVLTVGAVGLLGREVGGARIGVTAAFLTAVFPRFWASEGDILSESLFGLVIAVLLLLAFRAIRRSSLPLLLAIGIVIALAALTRAEAAMFTLLLVPPVVLVARERSTTRTRLVLVAVTGVLLVLAPWAAWNATRFERPVVLSNGLGTVLSGANCDATYHRPALGEWDSTCTDLPQARRGFRTGHPMDESVQDAELRDRSLRYVGDHAGRAASVSGVRVLRLLDLYHPHPFSYGPAWTETALVWGWYLLVPLAGFGVVVARRRGVSMVPFAATLVAVVLNAALTWGTPRFRVPLEISMVVLAAFALDRAAGWLRTRRRTVDPAVDPALDQPPVISEGAIPR